MFEVKRVTPDLLGAMSRSTSRDHAEMSLRSELRRETAASMSESEVKMLKSSANEVFEHWRAGKSETKKLKRVGLRTAP